MQEWIELLNWKLVTSNNCSIININNNNNIFDNCSIIYKILKYAYFTSETIFHYPVIQTYRNVVSLGSTLINTNKMLLFSVRIKWGTKTAVVSFLQQWFHACMHTLWITHKMNTCLLNCCCFIFLFTVTLWKLQLVLIIDCAVVIYLQQSTSACGVLKIVCE